MLGNPWKKWEKCSNQVKKPFLWCDQTKEDKSASIFTPSSRIFSQAAISQCLGYNQKEKNKCYIIFWNTQKWNLLEKCWTQFLLTARLQKGCGFLNSSISCFFPSNLCFYYENNIAEFVQETYLLKMILKSLSKMTVHQQIMASERLLLFLVRELTPEICSLLVSADLSLHCLFASVGGHMKQGGMWKISATNEKYKFKSKRPNDKTCN